MVEIEHGQVWVPRFEAEPGRGEERDWGCRRIVRVENDHIVYAIEFPGRQSLFQDSWAEFRRWQASRHAHLIALEEGATKPLREGK